MISGRGLGHTGGTLGKLDAIPGYATQPDAKAGSSRRAVRSAARSSARPPTSRRPTSASMRSATSAAPWNRSTSSLPRSSPRSSPPGSMRWCSTSRPAPAPSWRRWDARALARALVDVAKGAGCRTIALITDMNEPLATTAGNALEMAAAARGVRGEEIDSRLYDVTVALGAELLAETALAPSLDAEGQPNPPGLRLRRGRRALRPHGRGARQRDQVPRRLRGASRRRRGGLRRRCRPNRLRHRLSTPARSASPWSSSAAAAAAPTTRSTTRSASTGVARPRRRGRAGHPRPLAAARLG